MAKAKDPAFLFYPGDWMGGTMTLTRHQKGCYIDLLIAQFNDGPLSFETIKIVLGQDQAMWTVLSKKFKQDSSGNFYNERLAAEIEKRKNFVAKQSLNGSKGGRPKSQKETKNKPWVSSGLSNIENENEDPDLEEKGGEGEKEAWNKFPGPELLEWELPDINAGSVEQLWRITKKQIITREEIYGLWTVFKVQHLTGKSWYAAMEDVYSHFINWTKNQKIENGTGKSDKANGKASSSEARIAGLSKLS